MDVLGRLQAIGFREGAASKGFQAEEGALILWITGEPLEGALQNLLDAMQCCFPSPIDGCTVSHSWGESPVGRSGSGLSLTLRAAGLMTDVWVVGGGIEESLREKRRWETRGYRVRAVSRLENAPSAALVVRLDAGGKRGFSGYLPRHPQSGPVAQSWH